MASNQFEDQKTFMLGAGQTVGEFNWPQFERYLGHIREEAEELEAASKDDPVDTIDALCDLIHVCTGALWSLVDSPDDCWGATHSANMRKVNSYKPVFRKDGQIGKPEGWRGPELSLQRIALRNKLEEKWPK